MSGYEKYPPLGTPINEQLLERIVWGFVLIRCTYTDDKRWSLFLSELRRQTKLSDNLAQSWTTIEDKDNLDNATMLQASLAHQNWIDTIGLKETPTPMGPRYQFYLYVNDESIESVINPVRALEKTGNFLILVETNRQIRASKETRSSFYDDTNAGDDICDLMADIGDDTRKLIAASEFKGVYLNCWKDPDGWYDYCSEWQGPPYVFYRFPLSFCDADLIRVPDRVGLNVYKMMKQIYAKDHPRSVCFEKEEAETKLQRLRGYAGGYWGVDFADYFRGEKV